MFLNFQINMIVEDVEPCVLFYKAIGFEETYRTPAEGAAEHVEVRTLCLTLGVSSLTAAREVHGLHMSGEGNAVQVCLWRHDVDAAFERMLQAGACAVRERRTFKAGVFATGGCSIRPTIWSRSCNSDGDVRRAANRWPRGAFAAPLLL